MAIVKFDWEGGVLELRPGFAESDHAIFC